MKPIPVEFSWTGKRALKRILESSNLRNADSEPFLTPNCPTDAQGILIPESISFHIAWYPKGTRDAEWLFTFQDFQISVSPQCTRLLEGKKLKPKSEITFVSDPPITTEDFDAAYN